MDRPSTTFSSDPPWGGLAAIAIIILIEWVLYPSANLGVLAGRGYGDRIVASKLRYAREAPTSDYLILGDSTASVNWNARYLTDTVRRNGRPTSWLNLGLVGSTSVAGADFILTRYLEHHPKPAGVVLTLSPITINYRAPALLIPGRLVRFFNRPAEIRAYSLLGHHAVCRALLYRLVPSSEWNDFFEDFPRENLHGPSDLLRFLRTNARFYEQMTERRGFTPVTDQEPLPQISLKLVENNFNRLALRVLFEHLQRLDLEVYFAFATLPEGPYQATRQDPEAAASLDRFLAELKRQGVTIVPIPPSLPDRCFGSITHLKEAETPAYNIELARVLNSSLNP